jgi:hypothetical protein
MTDAPASNDPFSPRFRSWQSRVDAVLTALSVPLAMCGHGVRMGWSVRVAELFFTQCACCVFWRGVLVGLMAALAMLGLGLLCWQSPAVFLLAAYGGSFVFILLLLRRLDALSRRVAALENPWVQS